MSAIQEQILDAVKILANNAVNQSNTTTTIACKVVEQVDLTEYKVNYLDNIITAYNNNPSIVYNINDIVYVLVPEGDLSEKDNIIIGAAKVSASTYITAEASDIYVPVSNNLLDDINDIELCTYHTESHDLNIPNTKFNTLFANYLKKYNTYVFSARIRTNIPVEQQQGGNYGIILKLPILKDGGDGTGPEETYKAIAIDVNTMQGNPYRLNEYTLQNIYFEMEDGIQYDENRDPEITYFVQDFAQDDSDLPADIFIKDIEFKAIEVLQEGDQNGYYLTVVASEGNYFLNEKYSRTKILSPELKINSKNKKIDGYDCYWFVEDTSINTYSDEYFRLGGVGWKCLNKKTNVHYNEDGKMTWQYVTNVYKLNVSADEVESTLKYKCVLVKDDVVVSGSIQLENLSGQDFIKKELISATGYTNFVKDTGYINLIARIYYDGVTTVDNSDTNIDIAWQRFDRLNNFINSDNWYSVVRIQKVNGWLETEICFPSSLVEQMNTIHCTFYSTFARNDELIKSNLGSSSLIVTTSDDYLYKIAIQDGDVVYKYDADGDSPMVANYDGPASSVIKEIKPITFKIYKNDGSEFTDIEYLYCNTTWKIPKNSMIRLKTGVATREDDEYKYIEGQGIIPVNYTIIDSYNVKKSDNTVILEVDFRGTTLTEAVNIKFIKDGESGTNGSKYTAVIKYQDYAYGEKDRNGKIRKLQCIHASDGWWILNCADGNIIAWPAGGPQLTTSVYRDGVLMDLDASQGNTVEWSMFDETATNPNFSINSNGNLSYSGGFNPDSSSIVQAKITVGETGITGGQEAIYAYYPIEVTYLNLSQYSGIVPNLVDGFSEVVYAADGTNPKYDNTNPFAYADNLTEVDNGLDYYECTWSAVGNLIVKGTNNGNTCKVAPVTKFDNGVSKNYIKVVMEITDDKRSSANQKQQELLDELNKVVSNIGYQENKRDNIIAFSENFDYDGKILILNSVKEFLSYRSNLIIYINELRTSLENINTYCKNRSISTTIFNYVGYYDDIKVKLKDAEDALYELAHDGNLDGLIRLSDCGIDLPSEGDFKAKYGAGVYETLKSFVQEYNDILQKKYWIDYDILTAKNTNNFYTYQGQYLVFNTFAKDIMKLSIEYPNPKDPEHPKPEERNPLWNLMDDPQDGQEFINIKDQITILGKRIYTPAATIYSYDDINNKILKSLDNIFIKYKDDYYVTNCNNIIANLTLQQTEIQNKLKDFNEKIIIGEVGDTITHVKPIVMVFNRYELSNLNGWDGNKLYTQDGYLLAPQVGAGMKEGDRSFTGVFMGVKRHTSGNVLVGLFGYHQGVQSYFMNSKDGSVIMGKSGKGQIINDPSQNKALLYSSNYFPSNVYGPDGKPSSYSSINNQGMLINLTDSYIHFGSSASGRLYSGNHTSLNDGDEGFYLSQDGLSIGSKVCISSTGVAKFGDRATSGSVSGNYWTIDGNTDRSYIGYKTDTFNCSNLGDKENYSIGGSNGQVYIGTDGIRLGSKFAVDSDGNLVAKHLIARNGGNIGGWDISRNQLEAKNIEIKASGSIETKNFSESDETGWKISSNGTAYFNKIIANKSGSIAGWKISETDLSANGIKISANDDSGGGSISSSNWRIKSNGEAYFKNIHITGSGSYKSTGSGSSLNWGNGFSVDTDGHLAATGVDVGGKITATSGTIGGCSIVNGTLQVKDANITGTISVNKLKSKNETYITQWVPLTVVSQINTKEVTVKDGDGNNTTIRVFDGVPQYKGINFLSGANVT